MVHYFGGIDPGRTGALAIIDTKDYVVTNKFSDWLTMYRAVCYWNTKLNVQWGLEKIHAAGGNGAVSAFSFAKNCGGWEALLEIAGIEYTPVPVQSWQPKVLGRFPKGESKEAAIEKAHESFGLELTKKDSGVADALCIALYLRKMYLTKV